MSRLTQTGARRRRLRGDRRLRSKRQGRGRKAGMSPDTTPRPTLPVPHNDPEVGSRAGTCVQDTAQPRFSRESPTGRDRRERGRCGAHANAMAADAKSQREIAARLGINRRTVKRMLAREEPPRYRRVPQGSKVDPFEPVMRRVVVEWPEINAPACRRSCASTATRARSTWSAPPSRARPPKERPVQRTGYRPGQGLEVDWRSYQPGLGRRARSGTSTRCWAARPN